jgi:hypothetical protein
MSALPTGALQAIIQHPLATPDSLPIVTFYDDPGSRAWVMERGQGYFVIALAEPAPAEVQFGFSLSPALRDH